MPPPKNKDKESIKEIMSGYSTFYDFDYYEVCDIVKQALSIKTKALKKQQTQIKLFGEEIKLEIHKSSTYFQEKLKLAKEIEEYKKFARKDNDVIVKLTKYIEETNIRTQELKLQLQKQKDEIFKEIK